MANTKGTSSGAEGTVQRLQTVLGSGIGMAGRESDGVSRACRIRVVEGARAIPDKSAILSWRGRA